MFRSPGLSQPRPHTMRNTRFPQQQAPPVPPLGLPLPPHVPVHGGIVLLRDAYLAGWMLVSPADNQFKTPGPGEPLRLLGCLSCCGMLVWPTGCLYSRPTINLKPQTPESLSNYWGACLAIGNNSIPTARQASRSLDRLSGVWGFKLIVGRQNKHLASKTSIR